MNFATRIKKIIQLSVMLVLAVTISLSHPVNAQEADEPQPNPEVEEYILETLAVQNSVILDKQFPDEKDRVISGQFLVNLLRNPEYQDKQWITLRYATVVGKVEAYNLEISFDIFLYDLKFTHGVNFGGSQLQRLRIQNTTFEKFVYFDQIVIEKNLELQGSTFNQGVYFKGADIAGDLLMNNTKILGAEYSPEVLYASHPSEFWGMSVDRHMVLDGAIFEGETTFEDSTFYTASFAGTKFEKKVDFTKIQVAGDLIFNNASFSGDATFDQAETGDAFFQNASFAGLASFEEITVDGDLEMSGASFNAAENSANLRRINVGKSMMLASIHAPAGLDISQSTLNDLHISMSDDTPLSLLDLTQTEIDRQFEINSAVIHTFQANGLINNGTLTMDGVKIDQQLSLKNANFNLIVILGFEWPKKPENFNMRGMEYTDIDLGEKELTDETWQGLLYLIENSAYSPQAYQTLMDFLTAKGHPDWAQEVHLAMKRRERAVALEPFSAAWFWSWFLDIFTGYGNRPGLAFVWSALVVGIGAWVYRKEEYMLPVDQDDVKLRYNPFWYSFALFLPYIELDIAGKWEPNPERVWASNYKYFHKILGWVLMPIALLAFGGVLG